ncbi:MAG: PD40 domain-containing protein [Flavobacteriia bacterium]|nr:PD40 domain-containing protein [Flavobacteriia bacterium]
MQIRIYFILFSLSFIFNFSAFENDTIKKNVITKEEKNIHETGNKLMEIGKLRLALIEYKSCYQKNPTYLENTYKLGFCHYKLGNYGYAYQYAKMVNENTKKANIEHLFLLAQSCHQLEKIDSALFLYKKIDSLCTKKQNKELFLNKKINQCLFYQVEKDSLKKSPLKSPLSEINSDYHDYSALMIKEGKEIYFTSRRENTTGGRSNPDDEQYFEDNYRAVWNSNENKWDSISNQLERINSQGFDCISYLSADGLKGLMTLNNTAVQKENTTKSSDICEISFSNKGKWQSPKVIDNNSINSPNFDACATMTADGQTMYFVSDRDADKSMTDIFVVKKEGNKWGSAKPVSDSINTDFNETTPFISPDGRYLFFSSEGHEGLGGYDIYVSENMGGTWTKPVNLGYAINSVNDDTHFVFYPKIGKALFSSVNHAFLKSNIDIYEIDLNKYKIPKTVK